MAKVKSNLTINITPQETHNHMAYIQLNDNMLATGDEWILDPTLGQFEPQRGFRWAVWSPEHTDCLDRYRVEHILDLDEEDLYRRTVTTDGKTKIKDDFWSPDSKT